jgi:hypothetical protein
MSSLSFKCHVTSRTVFAQTAGYRRAITSFDNEATAGGIETVIDTIFGRTFQRMAESDYQRPSFMGRHEAIASKSLEILAPDKRDACLGGNHGQSISGTIEGHGGGNPNWR